MNKEEFRQWIFDNFNVGNNCTIGPGLLDSILDHADGMEPDEQQEYLKEMLANTDIRDGEIARVRY
ncbi:MAG: hypothetical protein IJ673_12730 [Treponema sp.]|nr:hypothetical protein [Treponema sp.]